MHIFSKNPSKTLIFSNISRKKSKNAKIIVKKLSHISKNSVKTTSDDGVYDAKKIILISYLVMKIFPFEVRGGY